MLKRIYVVGYIYDKYKDASCLDLNDTCPYKSLTNLAYSILEDCSLDWVLPKLAFYTNRKYDLDVSDDLNQLKEGIQTSLDSLFNMHNVISDAYLYKRHMNEIVNGIGLGLIGAYLTAILNNEDATISDYKPKKADLPLSTDIPTTPDDFVRLTLVKNYNFVLNHLRYPKQDKLFRSCILTCCLGLRQILSREV